jgi:hypothetical protein
MTGRIVPRVFVSVLGCGLVLVALGCSRHHEDEWSQRWPPRHPCSGTVEFDGAPLAGAVVTFFTEREERAKEPFSAVGMTGAEGKFVLKTFRPNDGAVAGDHVVMVEKREMVDGQLKTHLPAKYARKETSGLSATVSEKGPNVFVFKLTSK